MSFRCRSSRPLQACLAVLCGVGSLLLGAATAGAQTPPPGVQILPYRLIVSGLGTTAAGARVTFDVRSEPAAQTTLPQSTFVAAWSSSATFVSVTGNMGTVIDQGEQSQVNTRRVALGRSETATFTLDVDATFIGSLQFSVYVPGTSIQLAEGSVDSAHTRVTPPDVPPAASTVSPRPAPSQIALPSTGRATSTDDRSVRNFVLVGVIGAMLCSCGAYVARSRTRAR